MVATAGFVETQVKVNPFMPAPDWSGAAAVNVTSPPAWTAPLAGATPMTFRTFISKPAVALPHLPSYTFALTL
jgi:hypothetical protein